MLQLLLGCNLKVVGKIASDADDDCWKKVCYGLIHKIASKIYFNLREYLVMAKLFQSCLSYLDLPVSIAFVLAWFKFYYFHAYYIVLCQVNVSSVSLLSFSKLHNPARGSLHLSQRNVI